MTDVVLAKIKARLADALHRRPGLEFIHAQATQRFELSAALTEVFDTLQVERSIQGIRQLGLQDRSGVGEELILAMLTGSPIDGGLALEQGESVLNAARSMLRRPGVGYA